MPEYIRDHSGNSKVNDKDRRSNIHGGDGDGGVNMARGAAAFWRAGATDTDIVAEAATTL